MLLCISTQYNPATDLGYLMHKHPDRVQTFKLAFGHAHVFYPETTEEKCTIALLLDVNAVSLIRGRKLSSFALGQYVNDRPYVGSSFLSVAISKVFGTALNGKSQDRQDLANTAIPLTATIDVIPSRGSEGLLRQLFEPLGYTLDVTRHQLDDNFPDWGLSPYYSLTLTHTIKLSDLLGHLYVLIPVLDNDKHYFVGDHEVEKLLEKGEGWLNEHPKRDLIVSRYLKHQKSLRRQAIERLTVDDPIEAVTATQDENEEKLEKPMSLHEQRLGAVLSVFKNSGSTKVLDLGCGEGRLLKKLLDDKQFTSIVGMDVSHYSLELASERLKMERMPENKRERIELIHGSLMYRDPRLEGFDAAAVIEVIEHLDPPRLAAFERILFEFAQPDTVVITTPNREYNVMWDDLPAGKFRHRDHRFEWTRAEFQSWSQMICDRFNYTVRILPIGEEDTTVGSPSQMAIFEVNND